MEEEFKVSGLTTSSLGSNISTLYNNYNTSNIYTDTSSAKIDTFNIEDYIKDYNLNNCVITTTTNCLPTGCVTTDSNELKINIKKFQIKFNFNL